MTKKKGKIMVFFAIMCLFSTAASFAHPVTPTLIVERNLDSSMFGLALAAMMTMNFTFSPFWGRLCNYIPTKTIMMICGIGYAIGQFIFGSAYSEVQIIAGRMFAGIFTGGAFTACANYVVNTSSKEDRGSNLTIYSTITNVAGAVGYFVGGMMGLISVNFTFGAQVICLALSGVLFFFFIEDDTPYKIKPEKKLSLAEANPLSAFLSAKTFMTPAFALVFLIVAIGGIGQNSFEQAFNYYIKDFFQLSSAYNGIFKAVIAVLGMLANGTICMYIVKKTDLNKTFFPVIVACTVPLCLALLFMESLIPFALCDIVFFALNTVRVTVMQNLCASKASPQTSNSVMGFYQSMNSLGGIFGAAFAGIIYSTNNHYPFILAAATFVLTVFLSLGYLSKNKKA